MQGDNMQKDLLDKVQNDVRKEQKQQDGIPQIAAGFFLIVTMLMMLGSHGNLMPVFIPFIPILIGGLRKRFTYPRVGFAELPQQRRQRQTRIWVVAGLLILGLVLFFLSRGKALGQQDSRTLWLAFLIVIFAAVAALMVYRYRKDRDSRMIWYLAFILLLATAILLFRLHQRTVLYIVLGFGILNLVYGVVALIGFIRRYPVLADER